MQFYSMAVRVLIYLKMSAFWSICSTNVIKCINEIFHRNTHVRTSNKQKHSEYCRQLMMMNDESFLSHIFTIIKVL